MHVAIDASSWDNERGFGRFTRSLVGALAARETGNRYSLLLDQAPQRSVPDNVDVIIAGAGQSLSEASSGKSARKGGDLFSLANAARKLTCDVFFYPAVYSYFPLLSRTPSVVCFHDTIPERFPDLIFPSKLNSRLWNAKTWLAKHMASRVMTVSQTSADDLTNILKINRQKIDVITEGADAAFRPIPKPGELVAVRKKYQIPPEAKLLVYVGGFNRHKNVLRLIEAMPAILEQEPDAHLAIVGRTTGARFWDNADELQAGAASNRLVSNHVSFTGEISDPELARVLNAASALVFPSLWEGFGLPALESMACGTPVLASDQGSLPEIIGDAGLFFDPQSSQDIAEKTIRLLGNSNLAAELSNKAIVRTRNFSWERSAELAEDCFRNAVQKR